VRRGAEPLLGSWTVPGGRQRFGEPLRETARRETLEETGIEIEVGDPCWVGDVVDPAGQWHMSIVDFHAVAVGGTLAAGDDAAEARWVALDEAMDLVSTDGMRDLLGAVAAKTA
jgi:ADP-ribose pyrophosphatase YjhB (NUDIX family)